MAYEPARIALGQLVISGPILFFAPMRPCFLLERPAALRLPMRRQGARTGHAHRTIFAVVFACIVCSDLANTAERRHSLYICRHKSVVLRSPSGVDLRIDRRPPYNEHAGLRVVENLALHRLLRRRRPLSTDALVILAKPAGGKTGAGHCLRLRTENAHIGVLRTGAAITEPADPPPTTMKSYPPAQSCGSVFHNVPTCAATREPRLSVPDS
jgi:hypothetical protein